ncbi:flagellin [Frigidibacter sp. MR17.24]|uniref:flagellin n=1 Tax=Frigidibacter sp. MR17.24 TaxID=3127345 RepID=UPI003012E0E9
MAFASIGDLARNLQFRMNNTELRERLAAASTEMTTGRRSDVAAALGGDFVLLAGIERSERLSAVYLRSAVVVAADATTVQSSLEVLTTFATPFGSTLAATAELGMPSDVRTQTGIARENLEAAFSALNVRGSGGYLLSGQNSDVPPMTDPELMLDQLRAATAGLTSASDIAAAVDDWFAAPAGAGGFVDFYQGDAGPVARHRIGEVETVSLDITAIDPAIRTILGGLAIASLAGDMFGTDAIKSAALLGEGADRLVGSSDAIEAVRSRLGRTEQIIEDVTVRTHASLTTSSLLREKLIGIDTADAATDVLAVQNQLEALYTLTARVQQMKLVNFL